MGDWGGRPCRHERPGSVRIHVKCPGVVTFAGNPSLGKGEQGSLGLRSLIGGLFVSVRESKTNGNQVLTSEFDLSLVWDHGLYSISYILNKC